MFRPQRKTLLPLLKKKDYRQRYWLAYRDYLNSDDAFTCFAQGTPEEKREYLAMVERLLAQDKEASIFVEIYGLEEEGGQEFFYAETLIIFSCLPLGEIERVFNQSGVLFPSSIGELGDFSQHTFIIEADGTVVLAENWVKSNNSAYFCWWD